MGYVDEPHRATDDVIAAATWNQVIDNIEALHDPPSCRVYNSSNISVANNTNTALTFNTERYDTDTMHSTTSLTSRLTMTTAGKYLLTGHVDWASAGSDRRFIQILKDGATVIANVELTGGPTSMSVATVYAFAAGAYAELLVYQSSGGALNVLAESAYSPEFTATWVSG